MIKKNNHPLLGKKAPNFNLADKESQSWSLSDLLKNHDYLVIFFYPKDNTPGCTIEAKSFSKQISKLKKLKAFPVGISGGDQKSKQAFCKKHKLNVLLLSDPDFTTAERYGSFGEKLFMGRKYDGIFRNTFIVSKKRKILRVFEKVSPPVHLQEILEFLRLNKE